MYVYEYVYVYVNVYEYIYIYINIEFATEICAGVAERALAAERLKNAPLQLLGRLQRGVRALGEGLKLLVYEALSY
jgi:hypothetical protein